MRLLCAYGGSFAGCLARVLAVPERITDNKI